MLQYQILKSLKGGSFSSTMVIELPDGDVRVRKFISRFENREFGLVRWQSQIRRLQHLHSILPDNTPRIIEMGVDGSNFYYDIPFYKDSENLFDFLSKRGKSEAVDIFKKLNSLINTYSKISYGNVVGSFSVFFAEEVLSRLEDSASQLEEACRSGSISNDELSYVRNSIVLVTPIIDKIILDSKSLTIEETLTHGNLTLENALYDHRLDQIILIDPYSETYSESVLGDYSQLLQSSVSMYEAIVAEGEEAIGEFFERTGNHVKSGVDDFGDCLLQHLSSFHSDKMDIINLFHSAQFIRMFPFKIASNPRLAIYFLLHGLNIIKEVDFNA